jgi:hypothetical protein
MIHNLRKRTWIVLFLCVITYSPFSNAWSLFGPKNFEDCVLSGMKGVTGDFAAKAVYKSCRDKFPNNEKPSNMSQTELLKKKERIKRCGLEENESKAHHVMVLGGSRSMKISEFLKNIKNDSFDIKKSELAFQNSNSFGVSAILIGFTKDKRCSDDTNSYEVTTYCSTGSGTNTGVSSTSYGKLKCQPVPSKFSNLGYCLVGISPTYLDSSDEYLHFMEQNGMCK